jgi:hypothetical protein
LAGEAVSWGLAAWEWRGNRVCHIRNLRCGCDMGGGRFYGPVGGSCWEGGEDGLGRSVTADKLALRSRGVSNSNRTRASHIQPPSSVNSL